MLLHRKNLTWKPEMGMWPTLEVTPIQKKSIQNFFESPILETESKVFQPWIWIKFVGLSDFWAENILTLPRLGVLVISRTAIRSYYRGGPSCFFWGGNEIATADYWTGSLQPASRKNGSRQDLVNSSVSQTYPPFGRSKCQIRLFWKSSFCFHFRVNPKQMKLDRWGSLARPSFRTKIVRKVTPQQHRLLPDRQQLYWCFQLLGNLFQGIYPKN